MGDLGDRAGELSEKLQQGGVAARVADSLANMVLRVARDDADLDSLVNQVMEPWLLAQAIADVERQLTAWIEWPSPEAWQERWRASLQKCRPLQWQALMILWAWVPNFSGTSAPPAGPEELERHHFVPWKELEQCLREIEDHEDGGKRAQTLSYLKPDGRTETLLFYSNSGDRDTGARPSALGLLKECGAQVSARTGLRVDQSVAFLLCDAPVEVTRIGFAAEDDDSYERALHLRLVGAEVSADELRHAYRYFQKYLKSISRRDRPTSSGFKRFTAASPDANVAQPSDRTLLVGAQALVSFVEGARDGGKSWQTIMEEWNQSHPDRAAKSPRSLQANYYQARRRLKKRVARPEGTAVHEHVAQGDRQNGPRKVPSLRHVPLPSSLPDGEPDQKERDDE